MPPMCVILEVQRGSRKTRAIRLRSEQTIIGRRSGCAVRIPSSAVSRRHCRLTFLDGCLSVEDLGSANGTFLNGERVAGIRMVQPGALLEVGPITFVVKYQLAPSPIRPILPEEAEALEPEILPDYSDDVTSEGIQVSKVKSRPAPEQPAVPPAEQKKATGKKKKPATRPDEAGASKEDNDQKQPAQPEESIPWEMPTGENLRDLLSEIEDSE